MKPKRETLVFQAGSTKTLVCDSLPSTVLHKESIRNTLHLSSHIFISFFIAKKLAQISWSTSELYRTFRSLLLPFPNVTIRSMRLVDPTIIAE